jgi:hypothetical protein
LRLSRQIFIHELDPHLNMCDPAKGLAPIAFYFQDGPLLAGEGRDYQERSQLDAPW